MKRETNTPNIRDIGTQEYKSKGKHGIWEIQTGLGEWGARNESDLKPKPSGTPMTNTLKVQIITITALGE